MVSPISRRAISSPRSGETGYQAEIIPPGTFRISIFFNVLNRVDLLPVVIVPSGFYGRIVANDGEPLSAGQIMADAWPEADYQKFLDAQYFMTHGGQKGLQLSVLKPGVYPLNLALYQVKIGYIKNGKDIVADNDDVYDLRGLTKEETPLDTSITRVPAGSVGVVRSSVQSAGIDCKARTAKTDEGGLTAELVTQYCKGVWDTSLPPNDYYLNRDAYDVTLVSTRVTALEFKGGFTRRYLDLKVDAKGDFTQTERTATFPQPKDAADSAINTKIEGWEIPQELRAIVQITPENAPIVVAAVGGQDEVDQRILVPSIRSLVRNVYGGSITVKETQRQRRARRRDAPDPRARHDREPHGAGTGDSRARADRRPPRRRRHQGDSPRRIGDPAGTAAGPPARTARRPIARRLYPGADGAGTAPEDRAGARHRRPAARHRHRANRGEDRAAGAGSPPGRRPRRAALP